MRSLPAAFPADADEVHRVVLDPEAAPLPWRQLDVVQGLARDVDYPMARSTDKMVMSRDLSIEPRGRTGVVQPPDHAEPDQGVQYAVHRRPGQPRNAILDGVVDLVGGGMIVPFEDRLEDLSTLNRQRQPPLAAKGLELPKLRFDVVSIYRTDKW